MSRRLTNTHVKIAQQRRKFRMAKFVSEGPSTKCSHQDRPVPCEDASRNEIAKKGIEPGTVIVINGEAIPRKVEGFDEKMRLILAGSSVKPYPRDVRIYTKP